MTGRVTSPWLTLGSLVLASAFAGRASGQQQPLWADDLVPKQPPARNSVPAKDDPPLAANIGSEHPEQDGLRRLARIHDDQTYQDTGDPVIPTIGMVSHRAVDLYIPGRGIDFSFERRYSSHDSLVDGPLGFGWDHVYNARLAIAQGGAKVTLNDGNGGEDVYTTTLPSTVYTAPKGTYTLFKFEAPSTHILRNREGTRTYFVNGLLDRIEDPKGNALKFFYDVNSKLDYVIDTMGRTIDFSHDANGRLEWIQDFRGRRVEYYYDAQGNLTGVRTPTVTSTAGFNDFSNGRVERYTYLGGFNNLLDHKLTGIIRPNDVVSSTPPYGTLAVQFTYEQSPSAVFFGWCKTQLLGGTNAAGAAGGTITYAYTVLDSSTPISHANALAIGRLRTTVTNRKGFVTEYVTNQNGHVIQVIDKNGTTEYVTTNEYNADGELVKITQPNGNYTTIAYAAGPPTESPLVKGNTASITDYPGPIQTDQASRTRLFEYEPIFNNLISETDPLNRVTEYRIDYQEGASSGSNSVIGQLEPELLNIYTSTQIYGWVWSLLKDRDLNGDGSQLVAKGNIVQVRHPQATINPVGGAPLAALVGGFTNQQAVLSRTFNAYGQVTSETDEEENVTVYLYWPETDPDGDGVPTSGSGLDALTGGYLKREVEDTTLPYSDAQLAGVEVRQDGGDTGRNSAQNQTPANKTTDYLYNPSGSVIATVDPRGVRYECLVNELDETWKTLRATDVSEAATRGGGINGTNEDLAGQVFSYSESWKYDSNGNVVAHFVQNAGGSPDAVAVAGAPAGHWEEYWTYDILDHERTEKREHGWAGETATWTFGYDANENRTSTTFPEGNIEASTWDFRDQLGSVTRGAGSVDASQTSCLYDGNGNLRQSTDGRGKITIIDYDGFDRVKRTQLPIGTEEILTYDANSNVTLKKTWGHPGGALVQQVELLRLSFTYDARDRLIQIDRQDPQSALTDGNLTPSDGKVTTVYNFDRLSRTVFTIDDDSSKTTRLYDGAGRAVYEEDSVGNKQDRLYDDNDNLVKQIDYDIYPNGTFRSFESYIILDSLNRATSVTDNLGRTERFSYDSRGNVVYRSDAQASLSAQYINNRQVNNPGNTSSTKVDGFGRTVREESDLRVGGTGDGSIDPSPYNLDGRSTRQFVYDGNSNVRFAIDDKGNQTEYEYDSLNRLEVITYQDGTVFTQDYDANDNVVFWQDAVGSKAYAEYDDGNRQTRVVAPVIPISVVGSNELRYEYDGLNRMTRSADSVDNVFGSADDWVNEYTWDALGRPKTQKQNNRIVTNTWREESKKASIGYSSGVTVQYGYDALERATTVTQGVQLAAYSYAGPDRLLQRSDFAGVAQRYHNGSWNDTAYYDGARRPVKLDFVKGAVLLTGIEHGFDRANNRTFTRRLHNASKGDNFAYDSLYRLVTWERDVHAGAVGVPGGSSFKARHTFELDGAHSRQKTTRALPNQVPVPTVITVDDVHNYTAKQQGIGPQYTTWNQTFDLNGNKTAFTDQGTHPTYKYDFLDRLRVIQRGTEKVEFDYDAEGRRVRTRVTGLAGYPATTEFIHDGQHVIEEVNGSGQYLRRFYYGDNLDELVGYDNLAFYPGPGSYFYEQDAAGDVIAVHDAGGNVVERYTYGAYGSVFFATAGSVVKNIDNSDYGNPCLFRGLRYENYWDALYYMRARFLDCVDGTFMQRDPVGIWGDRGNVGNSKAYVRCNPINLWDPLGLQGDWWQSGSQRSCMECHANPAALNGGSLPGAEVYGTKETATFYKRFVIGMAITGAAICGAGLIAEGLAEEGLSGDPALPEPTGGPELPPPSTSPLPEGPSLPPDLGPLDTTPTEPMPPPEYRYDQPPSAPHFDPNTGQDEPYHWHYKEWYWNALERAWWAHWRYGGPGQPPSGK